MNRRSFVTMIGAGSLAPHVPRDFFAAAKLGKIGLQLYTVRTLMQQSVERTLAMIAAIGYKEVEFAGYFGRPPRSIKQLLKRNGMSSPAAHVGIDVIRGMFNRTIDEAAEAGHKWLVVPWLPEADRNSIDAIKRTADLFNRAADDADRGGMRFAYHNHDFEFKEIEGRRMYDVLLESTDAKRVQMEMDLYWIIKGGGDPAAYFARYPGRFPLFHVKDGGPAPGRVMSDVGKGSIDFGAIFAMSKMSGAKHYFVEHDSPADPAASVKASYEHLRALRY